MSKNVAVFVDVANIFYAAKAAGADIDYVTLLKAAVAGRDFVRAYAYTGLDPENENQRNFHSFLARHGYKVVSKDIRKYGDGKVKANLDIELVVDMMKTARNLDVAIVVSGDGDFAPAIRAVQEMGVRVEVISFRGNTSSDLIEVADAFYDITQVARVDRDSSRSGRRVAGDGDEDLSMTEVPDKQTEGRGGRRGRGRTRGGRPEGVDEVAASADVRPSRSGGRGIPSRTVAAAPRSSGGGRVVALPGEKLARAAGSEGAEGEPIEEELLIVGEDIVEGAEGDAGEGGAEGGAHRRRRRGGRGRGHGRSLTEDGAAEGEAAETEEGEAAAAPAARPNQFGSVWDSQIGMDTRPARLAPIAQDDDDFAEPEIPEYLLAERRRAGANRGGRGQGGGGRGVRSAYASAVDRERYGSRGTSSRYPEPARSSQPQSAAPRRRDDRPAGQGRPQGQGQGQGQGRRGGVVVPRPERNSSEPWSEVPPELEELLRAQLSTKLSRPSGGESASGNKAPAEQPAVAAEVSGEKAKPASRSRRKPASASGEAAVEAEVVEVSGEKAKPAPRSRRKPAEATADARGTAEGEAPAAPKKRAPARKKTTAAAEAAGEALFGGGEAPAGEPSGE